jgi:hypothetical protein
MKLRKLSPKLEHATEDYLISKGSSRECLTDEQFRVAAKYVKIWRSNTFTFVLFLGFAAFEILLIILIFRMAKSFIDSSVPSSVKEVVLISSVGEKRVPTIMFRNDFMIIAFAGWLCGMFTAKLIWFIMNALIGLRLRASNKTYSVICYDK